MVKGSPFGKRAKKSYGKSRILTRKGKIDQSKSRKEKREYRKSKQYAYDVSRKRSRTLPLRTTASRLGLLHDFNTQFLRARGALCRPFSTLFDLARPHFVSVGYESRILQIHIREFVKDKGTLFKTYGAKHERRKFLAAELSHGTEDVKVFDTYESSKANHYILTIQEADWNYAIAHADKKILCRLIYYKHGQPVPHAVACVLTRNGIYILQTWSFFYHPSGNRMINYNATRDLLRETFNLGPVVHRKVIYGPDDVVLGEHADKVDIQRFDIELQSRGECSNWSLIIPYVFAKHGAFDSDNVEDVREALGKEYEATLEWTKDTYAELSYEMDLL